MVGNENERRVSGQMLSPENRDALTRGKIGPQQTIPKRARPPLDKARLALQTAQPLTFSEAKILRRGILPFVHSYFRGVSCRYLTGPNVWCRRLACRRPPSAAVLKGHPLMLQETRQEKGSPPYPVKIRRVPSSPMPLRYPT